MRPVHAKRFMQMLKGLLHIGSNLQELVKDVVRHPWNGMQDLFICESALLYINAKHTNKLAYLKDPICLFPATAAAFEKILDHILRLPC